MKQCPNCGAQMADESKFCGECGKEYPQGNTCPYCGARVYDGDVYCEKCGRNLNDGSYAHADYAPKSIKDYSKIIKYSFMGVAIALFASALVGGAWFGFQKYSAYRTAKEARLKFVADSLEKARKDSIKIAERKEKEKVEEERISTMREELSSENVLALIKNINNSSLAKKCGLAKLYQYDYSNVGETEDEEIPETYNMLIYGREVSKKNVSEEGTWVNIDVIPLSDHACYLEYFCGSDCGYSISFRNEEDGNYFLNEIKKIGVYKYEDTYLIPKKRKFKGVLEVDEFDYEEIDYGFSELHYSEGWYVINIIPY